MKKRFHFVGILLPISILVASVGCGREKREAQNMAMKEDEERLPIIGKAAPISPSYPVPLVVEPPSLATPEARQPSAILADLEVRDRLGENSKPVPLPEERKP